MGTGARVTPPAGAQLRGIVIVTLQCGSEHGIRPAMHALCADLSVQHDVTVTVARPVQVQATSLAHAYISRHLADAAAAGVGGPASQKHCPSSSDLNGQLGACWLSSLGATNTQ